VTNKQFAKTWVHGGFLQIDKEKMSKSLGNFVTIRDALQDHSAEALRYLLLASHYRSPLVYTDDTLVQAQQSLTRFYTAMRFLPDAPRAVDTEFEKKFTEAMDDDFNTPIALAVLFDLAHEIQRLRDKDPQAASAHAALLRYLGGVLGVLQQDVEKFFQQGTDVDVIKIETLIAAREKARAEKNFAEADRIRKELADLAIVIEDGATGTTWKKA
jgi:cysteinyl-tRNA synthetase